MLIVNGKRINVLTAKNYRGDPKDKDFLLMTFIAKKIKEVESLGDPIVFKDSFKPQTFRTRQAGEKVSKGTPKMPRIFIRYSSTITDKQRGREDWIYAESSSFDEHRNEKFKPRGKWMAKPWYLNQGHDLEKILYLMVASSYVRVGRVLLEDREKEAKAKFFSNDHEFIARQQIMTYGDDLEKLIDAARVVGLYNVESYGIDQLRLSILNEMLKKHTSGRATVTEQISTMKDNDLSLIRIAISYSKEDKLIAWQSKGSGYWYLDQNGKPYQRIITVASNQQLKKEDVLVDHFSQNPGAFDELREALVSNGHKDMTIKQFIDFSRPPVDGFENMERDDLRKWLGHAGFEGKGQSTTKEMKRLLTDYYFNEPEQKMTGGSRPGTEVALDFNVLPESGTFEGVTRPDLVSWGVNDGLAKPGQTSTADLITQLDEIHFPTVD